MKQKNKTILAYVQENPGHYSTEISRGTGISSSTVTSCLREMTLKRVVARSGRVGKFRYTMADVKLPTAERAIPKPPVNEVKHPFGCANPLTILFNQRLAEVRGGRRA